MNFAYSEEQQQLADSLRKALADHWRFAQRRKRSANTGHNRDAWNLLADIGVSGLLVPELYGGFGESVETMTVVHIELGRSLVSEPVIPSAVMATALLSAADNQSINQLLMPRLAAGHEVIALAYLEPGQQNILRPEMSRASRCASGYTLTAEKKLVWGGNCADHFIVSALLDGTPALFLVSADSRNLTLQDFPTMDGYRLASLKLEQQQLDESALIAVGKRAEDAMQTAVDYGITAVCAQASGAMSRLIAITIDYLKTRKQFGRPLADFQILQHRLADMVIQQEIALSMAYVATRALRERDIDERKRLLSSAKLAVADAGRFIGQNAVQLHGGMGMTDELEVGDYFKRLICVDHILGNSDFHIDRLDALF